MVCLTRRMQLSFVMIQGDHVGAVGGILERMGYLPTGRELDCVPGCLVWRETASLVESASAPSEVVRVGRDQGWTLLSDESGELSSDPRTWNRVAAQRDTQVVTLCASEDLWSFTVHGPEGLRRAVVVEDEVVEHGAPLPIEALFSGKAKVEDLMALVASMGLDFEGLNERAHYRLIEVHLRGASTQHAA